MLRAACRYCLWASGLLLVSGCSPQDGECLTRISRYGRDRLQRLLVEWANNGLAPPAERATWTEHLLAARVQARLQWDRELAGASLQVVVQQEKVVLQGTVTNAAQRRRALELAGTTTGVNQVEDQLQIQPP